MAPYAEQIDRSPGEERWKQPYVHGRLGGALAER
jgi:hypothetical protein